MIFRNEYFEFLFRIVAIDDISANYRRLLQQLFGIRFYAVVPHDENRAADGIKLRDVFGDKEGAQALSFCPIGDCNMLEMLIGLAHRLEIESYDSSWYKTPGEWFWFLMDNLGFTDFTDEQYVHDETKEKVVQICDTFLERRYNFDGKGGLFPLKNAQKDQKKVEIWYQMTQFILENYPI